MSDVAKSGVNDDVDEIDLFQVLFVLMKQWKLLVLSLVVGILVGGAFFLHIKTRYTAEFKVNIVQVQPDGVVVNLPAADFMLRMTDERLQEAAEEAFLKINSGTANKQDILCFSSEVDKKNAGITTLSASCYSRKLSTDYLKFLPGYLSTHFNNEYEQDEARILSEIKPECKEMFDKMNKANDALKAFDQDCVRQFEEEKMSLSVSELEGLYASYRSLKRQREYLEDFLPEVDPANAAKICDVFVSTCPNLSQVGNAEGADKIWSVVVEFRKLAEAQAGLQSEIARLPSHDCPEAVKLQAQLSEVGRRLADFSQVTIAQLRARKEILMKQEADLSKLIEQTRALKDDVSRDRIRYADLKGEIELLKNNHALLSSTLTKMGGKIRFKMEFKVVSYVIDVKTNLKRKLLFLFLPSFVLVVLSGVSVLLYNAFMQRGFQAASPALSRSSPE